MSSPLEPDSVEPPRLAAAWLSRALGPGVVSESILGDLWEEYSTRRVRSAWGAAAWYWVAAIRLGLDRGSRRAASATSRLLVDIGEGGLGMMRDLKHTLAGLARRPLFTAFAVLSVAIGIGAATAASSVLNAVFLRSQDGVTEPDAMVDLMRRSTGQMATFSYPEVLTLQSGLTSLNLTAVQYDDVNIGAEEGGFPIWGMYVSASYFGVMGAAPQLGRPFLEGEDVGLGEHPVAVVSDGFWRERLGADPGAVGTTLRVNGEPVQLIGVAPAGFTGHLRGLSAEIWLPLTQDPRVRRNPDVLDDRAERFLWMVGRLAPGRTRSHVQAQADAVAASLTELFPDGYESVEAAVDVVPYNPLPGGTGARPIRVVAFALSVLVGLVLLITVTNVAGMLLARSAGQRREVALRMALGASRARLTSYLLAETLVLFLLGGVGGVALAWGGTRALDLRALPIRVPMRLDFGPDAWVVVGGLGLALAAGLFFGVGPALWATRAGISPLIKDDGATPEREWLRRLSVGGQIAMSLVLVSVGLTFMSSARHAGGMPLGFDLSGRLTVTAEVGSAWNATGDETWQVAEELLDYLQQSSAFQAVALSSDLPLDGNESPWPHLREGADPEGPSGPGVYRNLEGRSDPSVYRNVVSSDYFRTLGIPLLRGRIFDQSDVRGGPRVAVVNRAYAERFGEAGSILGSRFYTSTPDELIEIVGVVEDVPDGGLRTLGSAMYYLPLPQRPQLELEVTVWTRSDDQDAPAALARILRQADPDISLGPVRSLEEVASLATFEQRAGVAVTSVLAAIGLLLSGLGLYGVVALQVSNRRREIGIRMALGALHRQVERQVLWGGLKLAIPGVLAGSLAAVGLARVLGFLLYDVGPADPLVIGGMAAAGVVTVALASWGPARSAAATDPAITLRLQ